MTYRDEEVRRWLRLGEDSRREFKEIAFDGSVPKGPSRNDWADSLAAFANARGGVVLCGVTDDGHLQDQDMSPAQIAALDKLLVEVSSDSIKPAIRIHTYHLELSEGQLILLVEVPEGDSRHISPGGSFVRVGASKRKMTSEEELRLAQRRGQARFRSFDEQAVDGTGFETLDEGLYKPLLSAEGAADPESALRKLALLCDDKAGVLRATVAGVLLCTRNPEQWLSNACITATRYRGKDRTSGQVDAQEITGPLNRQITDAVAFSLRNMRVGARKEPGRVDLPQYSDQALFEALVNAVAHRDYSMRGSRIRLSMFEDRLEIQSPGALPNNLTVESMTERQVTRNDVLASVLGRMPVGGLRGSEDRQYFMERRGDGVPIIRRETQELCGKLPEFRLVNDSEVCLTIPAAIQEHSPACVVITVWSAGRPLHGASLLTLFPNKTWKRATTDEDGEATVDLHTTHLPMTVFVSAPGYAAYLEREWEPSRRALAVNLEILREGGSIIFPEGTGYIPGLRGRLNPIRDSSDRTYLYASNITIDRGKQQPVHFVFGEDLRLIDADGKEAVVRILDITGRSALLEYWFLSGA